MGPTIYGVDAILLPEQLRGTRLEDQGKVVEVNGHNSGASFYRIGEFDAYNRIVSELRPRSGKMLFSLSSSDFFHTIPEEQPDVQQCIEEKLWKIEHPGKLLHHNFPFNDLAEIASDHVAFERSYAQHYTPPLSYFLLNAAHDMGIDADPYCDIETAVGTVRYRRIMPEISQEENERLLSGNPIATFQRAGYWDVEDNPFISPLQDIGLVWGNLDASMRERLGRERIVNDTYMTAFLNNKALQALHTELLPRALQESSEPDLRFFPRSFLYGCALHTQEAFREWLDRSDAKLFVKKPLKESYGIGVRFLSREELLRYDVPSVKTDETEGAFAWAASDLLFGKYGTAGAMLVQEAVPSKEIIDPETGAVSGGCARAIVANGHCIGAMWRTKGVGGDDLTSRFRYNTTNGARVLPVDNTDLALIGEIAEAAVAGLERSAVFTREATRVRMMSDPTYNLFLTAIEQRNPLAHSTGADVEMCFYLDKLMASASAQGVDLRKVFSQE